MSETPLKIGILGCGAIAQFAHISAIHRCRRARLVALCDGAEDLLRQIGMKAGVDRLYRDYDTMLADAEVQAVIIAAPDAFHVPLAIQALQAGKHVLVEKPLGPTSEQCLELARVQQRTGLKLQVGSMKRHDPGVRFAHEFLRESAGQVLSVGAVYRDSIFRPEMQRACLDPLLTSSTSIRPDIDPKADRESYNLTTQGAHLFDTIHYLGGRVVAVTAVCAHQEGNWTWHGLLEFASGGRGHFELTCKACGDWCERYEICGMHASVQVDVSLPFYHRPAHVRAFDNRTKCWTQPLGSLSNAYANQIDAFAESVLDDKTTNPDVLDGLVTVQILEAVQQSINTGRRTEVPPAVL